MSRRGLGPRQLYKDHAPLARDNIYYSQWIWYIPEIQLFSLFECVYRQTSKPVWLVRWNSDVRISHLKLSFLSLQKESFILPMKVSFSIYDIYVDIALPAWNTFLVYCSSRQKILIRIVFPFTCTWDVGSITLWDKVDTRFTLTSSLVSLIMPLHHIKENPKRQKSSALKYHEICKNNDSVREVRPHLVTSRVFREWLPNNFVQKSFARKSRNNHFDQMTVVT